MSDSYPPSAVFLPPKLGWQAREPFNRLRYKRNEAIFLIGEAQSARVSLSADMARAGLRRMAS